MAANDCIQVDSARTVGFYWNEDGRQPYWGLKKKSIARNKGDNAKLPSGIAYDLVGQGRIEGDIVDIGCYECWPVSLGLLLLVK